MDEITQQRLGRLSAAAKEAARQAQADREARDAAIWEADQQGETLGAIARAMQMSTGHVQRIVVRETMARQTPLP